MKILVTGATGFVGRELCRELHQAGHSLVIFSCQAPQAGAPFVVPCELFQWTDYRSQPPLEAFEGVEAVIHLMGESIDGRRWSKKQKEVLRESRILSAMNLIEGGKNAGCRLKVWIGGSAMGIYGDRGDEHLTEQSSLGNDFLAELCKEWENSAKIAEDLLGCRSLQVRIGLVLGEGGLLAKLRPLFRLGLGGRLGNGKQWMSWIHVVDLARLIRWALENPGLTGPINGVSLNPARNKDFTKALAEAMKVRVGPPVPRIALRITQGEIADAILSSQRVVPEVAVKNGFRFQYPSLAGALR